MEACKRNAAKKATEFVKDGMVVGLGSGSTTTYFIKFLGRIVRSKGIRIACVPTSFDSRLLAIENGLKVVGADEADMIDVAVDGADAVAPDHSLIKGMGGALAQEKVIDYSAKKFICIVDKSKLKKVLRGTVPVEVLPTAYRIVGREIKRKFSGKPTLRMSQRKKGPVMTDNGNFILDVLFRIIKNPGQLERQLNTLPGVVENGIFSLKKPAMVIVGKEKGTETM